MSVSVYAGDFNKGNVKTGLMQELPLIIRKITLPKHTE